MWHYDSLEDSSSRVTTSKPKNIPSEVLPQLSKLVKNLTINPHYKSDENSTLSCHLETKSGDKLLKTNVTSVTIGYIRSHISEPHFGRLKFNGDKMIEIYKNPYNSSYR